MEVSYGRVQHLLHAYSPIANFTELQNGFTWQKTCKISRCCTLLVRGPSAGMLINIHKVGNSTLDDKRFGPMILLANIEISLYFTVADAPLKGMEVISCWQGSGRKVGHFDIRHNKSNKITVARRIHL